MRLMYVRPPSFPDWVSRTCMWRESYEFVRFPLGISDLVTWLTTRKKRLAIPVLGLVIDNSIVASLYAGIC